MIIARSHVPIRPSQICSHHIIRSVPRPKTRRFHNTRPRHEPELLNHYATLDLPIDAQPSEIKKQFYKLSKAYHPDLHPNDAHASERFVQLSEAYAVLGVPDKRTRYDRDLLRASPSSSHPRTTPASHHPTGSYSSASTPAGGRPASGLSKRRTQFKGPPPSFYRSGGWGEQTAKREEFAQRPSHLHDAQRSHPSSSSSASSSTSSTSSSTSSTSGGSSSSAAPGTGPGGFSYGFDDDVPHFDHEGHLRTHSDIERTRHRSRRRGVVREEDLEEAGGDGRSTAFNFVVLTGMLVAIWGISLSLLSWTDDGERRRKVKGAT